MFKEYEVKVKRREKDTIKSEDEDLINNINKS